MKFTFALALLALTLCTSCASSPNSIDRMLFNSQTNITTATDAAGHTVKQTNVVFSDKAVAVGTVQTAGGILGGLFGLGGLPAIVLMGAYHFYQNVRNKKITGALIQTVETAKEVLKTTPLGQQASQRLTSWMIDHQSAAGVLAPITSLVNDLVDTNKATSDAKSIAVDLPARL